MDIAKYKKNKQPSPCCLTCAHLSKGVYGPPKYFCFGGGPTFYTATEAASRGACADYICIKDKKED